MKFIQDGNHLFQALAALGFRRVQIKVESAAERMLGAEANQHEVGALLAELVAAKRN